MNLKDIQTIAQERGIKPGKIRKGDLIRTIQREEGNQDCFESDKRYNCDQFGCLWRDDCVNAIQ